MCKLLFKCYIIFVTIIIIFFIIESIYIFYKEENNYLEFKKIWNSFFVNFNQLTKNSTETLFNSNLIFKNTSILHDILTKIKKKLN